jgi:hypothetical protein
MYDLQVSTCKLDILATKSEVLQLVLEDAGVVEALFEFGVIGHNLLTPASGV